MTALLEMFSTGQLFAMVGALVSFLLIFVNGFKEKQEGKDQGRKEVREEWQEREAEAHRIIESSEDDTIEMVDAVEANVEHRPSEPDTGDELRDGYKLPDYHYEK